MNELEVKKVPFMGTELMAARDNDGQIWAGVRWICNGIGMSKTQTNSQVEKIKEDKTLVKGYGNFRIPTNGGQQNTLCLKLDYVPLWLAKISITPKMERETPELAATLEQYQLKAKDVLAAAFLPQFKQNSVLQNITPFPVEQRALTTDDYITAARLASDCRNERLPHVLGFLAKGGFDIPKVESLVRQTYKPNPLSLLIWLIFYKRRGGVMDELIDALVYELIEDTRDDNGATRFVYLKEHGVIVNIETCTDLKLICVANEQLHRELDEVNCQLKKLECLKRRLQQ